VRTALDAGRRSCSRESAAVHLMADVACGRRDVACGLYKIGSHLV